VRSQYSDHKIVKNCMAKIIPVELANRYQGWIVTDNVIKDVAAVL